MIFRVAFPYSVFCYSPDSPKGLNSSKKPSLIFPHGYNHLAWYWSGKFIGPSEDLTREFGWAVVVAVEKNQYRVCRLQASESDVPLE
jgi:hypothetical protein